jgi:hypothetical protein
MSMTGADWSDRRRAFYRSSLWCGRAYDGGSVFGRHPNSPLASARLGPSQRGTIGVRPHALSTESTGDRPLHEIEGYAEPKAEEDHHDYGQDEAAHHADPKSASESGERIASAISSLASFNSSSRTLASWHRCAIELSRSAALFKNSRDPAIGTTLL